MLDNVSGIIISAADLRSAPEEVRNWIMGERPAAEETPVVRERPADVEPYPVDDTPDKFSMPKFIEEAKAFMGEHGPPAMLSLLREVGAERVSQCSEDQAVILTTGMRNYESR